MFEIRDALLKEYERVNELNAESLRSKLEEADIVAIHDPPAGRLDRALSQPARKWIWRRHIDVSRPYRPVWRYLRQRIYLYDSIWSLSEFFQPLPHPSI